jgi:DNA invertase Pin-like site-specific DNA recombinase
MQQAIGYVRISNKDQSNFSLDGQEKTIRDFAAKNGFDLVALFRDDGQSAKNFDRPDWKALERFIKGNGGKVHFLLVMKYDRFSRHVADALKMIEVLENRYSIRVMSAMEPIMLHPQSPYFFQFRTQMLLGAQVEWLVIKDRTRFGLHQALSSGRYCGPAPTGYTNARDEQNKPILKVDPATAPAIRKLYTLFLQGTSLREIKLEVAMLGYNIKGNSAVRKTLQNPVYAGLVRVPEYYDDKTRLVKAIHEAIIDEATWWRVQDIFNQSGKQKKTILNDAVPLRGVLKCFCGRHLTAGETKGKTKYIWYYKCNSHSSHNHNARLVNEQMSQIMQVLSLEEHHVAYLQQKAAELLIQTHGDMKTIAEEKRKELRQLIVKCENLEEKFIDGDLDKSTFQKWHTRYKSEIAIAEKCLKDAEHPDQVWEQYYDELPLLTSLHYFYERASLPEKQALLRARFNNSLYYQDKCYRTPFVLPFFRPKLKLLAQKRLLIFD